MLLHQSVPVWWCWFAVAVTLFYPIKASSVQQGSSNQLSDIDSFVTGNLNVLFPLPGLTRDIWRRLYVGDTTAFQVRCQQHNYPDYMERRSNRIFVTMFLFTMSSQEKLTEKDFLTH